MNKIGKYSCMFMNTLSLTIIQSYAWVEKMSKMLRLSWFLPCNLYELKIITLVVIKSNNIVSCNSSEQLLQNYDT